MLKTKINLPKNKPHQKAKTLQSFCKYQSNRFNQATFQSGFQNKPKPNIALSQTDLKIQSIKRKYGIPPRNTHHQRYFSVAENFSSSHLDLSQNKSVLKEKSLSNFSNHMPQKSFNKQIEQPKSIEEIKPQMIQNKQNFTLKNSYAILQKEFPNANSKINYNDTFSKQALKSTRNEYIQQNQQKPLYIERQIAQNKLEQSQALQSRRSKKINKTQQDFWSNSYIPRLQNIQKINMKIKSALQNFETFQKRDISISLSKTKAEKTVQPKSQVKKSYLENDLFETRVLQNIPCHRRTTSYFTTRPDVNYSESFKTEASRESPSVRVKTETYVASRRQTTSNEKPISTNEDNLFSRIKSLYKRSEQIKQKKAEIIDCQPRTLSHSKVPQNKISPKAPQQLRSSSLASDKMQKLQEIKNKYSSKVSFRSAYTQNEGQKTDNRLSTVRKSKSPEKPAFNMIYVKEDKSQSYGDEIQNFDQNDDKVNELYASQLEQIITLTKSSIQARRKAKEALETSKSHEQNHYSKKIGNQDFCEMLIKQIELDQTFRKAKYWFKYQIKGRKWDQLNEEFSKLIKKLQENYQTRKIDDSSLMFQLLTKTPIESHFINFQMLDEEIDPFFSLRVFQFTYKSLVEAYIQSETHWNSICRSGIFIKLIQNNWIMEIDTDKKGYANLPDLVRFFNFSTQSFFKNRDLALIYKRLTSDGTTDQTIKNTWDRSQTIDYRNIHQNLQVGVSHKKMTLETLRKVEAQALKRC